MYCVKPDRLNFSIKNNPAFVASPLRIYCFIEFLPQPFGTDVFMSQGNSSYTIICRKFDGQIHQTWKAELIKTHSSLLVFKGVFGKEIKHYHLGVIKPGTIAYEYFWLNKCYSIFKFLEPDGRFRNFYCNINQHPILSESVLDYVDLDIDILVWEDCSFEILDLDEFAENSQKYNYPADLIAKVDETLKELLYLLENKSFPFNFDVL